MSEAELAIEEKLRKKRQEEQQAWKEYLEVRAKQRAKEEDELKKLKERQVSVTWKLLITEKLPMISIAADFYLQRPSLRLEERRKGLRMKSLCNRCAANKKSSAKRS